MAKPKDKVEEEVVVKDPVLPVVMVSPPRNKVYSLEQWAQLRKKPARHLSGMRAFLGNDAGNKFSLEIWDAKMMAY